MSRPGDRLRALAARVFNAEAMERLIDPVVADLQAENVEAVRAGRMWTSLWVRVSGYAAFVKVVAFCTWEASMGAQSQWTSVIAAPWGGRSDSHLRL